MCHTNTFQRGVVNQNMRQTECLQVVIPQKMMQQIQAEADREASKTGLRITKSDIVRRAIRAMFEKNETEA